MDQTKIDLETARTEKAETEKKLDDKIKDLAAVTEKLANTVNELHATNQVLAAYQGVTPEQVVAMTKDYKNLQDTLAVAETENKILGQKIKKLETELAVYRDPNFFVTLPAGLKGKVLVADPKWNFVVLNVGEDQGVLERGELLVNRNGKLVAKVVVRSVQKDRCIANVMPGWELGEVMEGDLVIPAHPAS